MKYTTKGDRLQEVQLDKQVSGLLEAIISHGGDRSLRPMQEAERTTPRTAYG